MTVLSALLSLVLLAISAIHLLWAIGYWWPIRDEAALARTVVGTQAIERMPGAVPCALVGTALLVLAAWLHFPQEILWIRLGTGIAAAVFLVRGLAAWHPAFHRLTPDPAFRSMDRKLYGPLCLGLGLALAVLAVAA